MKRLWLHRRPTGDAPLTWTRGSRLAHPVSGRLHTPPASRLLRLLRTPIQTPNQSPKPRTRPRSIRPGACGLRRRSQDSPPARFAPASLHQEHGGAQREALWIEEPTGRPNPSSDSQLTACHPVPPPSLPARSVRPTSGPRMPSVSRTSSGPAPPPTPPRRAAPHWWL